MDPLSELIFPTGGGDPTSQIDTPQQNPSVSTDWNSLFGNLVGDATQAYAVNQETQANIAYANAQAAAGNPLNALGGSVTNFFSTASSSTWLIVGAGILAFALILRR